MTDPNAHITEALDAYLNNPRPVPHAFLLDGPWGSGKTWFLKRYFKQRVQRIDAYENDPLIASHKPIYVSLFGVQAVDVLQARMREALSDRVQMAALVGDAAEAAGGYLNFGGAARVFQRRFRDRLDREIIDGKRPLVFDDIERIEPAALIPVIGHINRLVETHDLPVILVADESKLGAEWTPRAEKLVGRRARIKPNTEAVLDRFEADNWPTTVKAVVRDERASILQSFERTKTGNLRNLTWALIDLGSLLQSLPEAPIDPAKRSALVRQMIATTIELRAGTLSEVDLSALEQIGGGDAVLMAMTDLPKEATNDAEKDWATLLDRLDGFVSRHSLPRDHMPFAPIIEVERQGTVDAASLVAWLAPNDEEREVERPAWRQLQDLYDHDGPRMTGLINEVVTAMREGKIVEPRAILSLASTAARLTEISNSSLTGGEPIPSFFEEYAKRLQSEERLRPPPPSSVGNEWDDDFQLAPNGDSIFQETRARLRDVVNEVSTKEAGRRADYILTEAEAGRVEPFREFDNNPELGILQDHPGFAEVAFDRMASLLLYETGYERPILRAFTDRYHYASHKLKSGDARWKKEIEWMAKAVEEAERFAAASDDPAVRLSARLLRGRLQAKGAAEVLPVDAPFPN